MSGTRLRNALAVVTGASSGIGEATARALAARGSRVVLLARNPSKLDSVVSSIRSAGGQAEAHVVDLADAQATSAAARSLSSFGVPDVLVNNAGAGRWLPIAETTAEDAARMMAVPYLAAFNLTRELLPGMLQRGSGRIVNVTSVASRLTWPGATAYTAARWAMEGFTHALRADLHGSGIGVTLATFGTVETPYWENNPGSRERLPKAAGQIPVLTADQAGTAIADGIEKGKRLVVKPAVFRFLFLLNALSPAQTEAVMRRK